MLNARTRRDLLIWLLAVAVLLSWAGIRYPHMLLARAPSLTFDETDPAPNTATPRFWLNYTREYLAELRAELGLDALVRDSATDYERVRAVTAWVSGLWRHSGSNAAAESDPLSIVRAAAGGERFRCVEYAVVIAGCLEALGIQARVLGLKTRDVDTRASGAGHVVAEAYLRDLGKWIMIDGQWGVIPERDGTPLNAVELQRALAAGGRGLTLTGVSGLAALTYRRWIIPYLYYFDTQAEGEHIMLGPVGAPEPRAFQGKHPLKVDMYTHAVKVFYEGPE